MDASQRNLIAFGKTLAAAMESRQMTQHDLAKKSGVPQPTISVICSGHRPASLETMSKICGSLEWGVAQRIAASYFQLVGCGPMAHFVVVTPATEDSASDLERFDRESGYALSALISRVKKADLPGALDGLALFVKALA